MSGEGGARRGGIGQRRADGRGAEEHTQMGVGDGGDDPVVDVPLLGTIGRPRWRPITITIAVAGLRRS